MNYRHLLHAGNFADVLKHATLLHLLAALQAKEKGLFYLDTHAGRGRYELAAAARGTSLTRAPEWPDGVGRLWGRNDLPGPLADYVNAVREFDVVTRTALAGDGDESGRCAEFDAESEVAGPLYYPGSPCLVAARLRPQDRAALCERHPEEAAELAAELKGSRRVSVQVTDGYTAVRAMLPPPERRALVLIDPPFEAQDEWSAIIKALSDGLARLPGATYAVWYPLTARARVDLFYRRLLALPKLPPCFTVELLVGGEGAGLKLWGCGLLVVNPPWGSARPLDDTARWLVSVLAQASGATGGVHWLVNES